MATRREREDRGLGNEMRFFLVVFILTGTLFVALVRREQPSPFQPPSRGRSHVTTTGRNASSLALLHLHRRRNWTSGSERALRCDYFARRHAAAAREQQLSSTETTTETATETSGFASIDRHRREAELKFWRGKPKLGSDCPINFTFATQATPERLWMLKFICKRWVGPIVVAVYQEATQIVQQEPECTQAEYVIVTASRREFRDSAKYPVNALRNAAIARVRTSHFLLCDVDLWPDVSLLRRLHVVAKVDPKLFRDPLRAVVVAAFAREVKTDCSSSTATRDAGANYRMRECYKEAELMPGTFTHLKDCIVNKECHVFDRYNQDGHGTTDYRSWLRQASARVRHVSCFLSNRYEPYVVLARSPLLPAFEEQFTGYGKNKIQHLVHLRYVGWKFSVLPRSFLTHFPHHKSAARMTWERRHPGSDLNVAGEHRTAMDSLYRRFLDTLIDVYGSPGTRSDTTLLCGSSSSSSSSANAAVRTRGRRRVFGGASSSSSEQQQLAAEGRALPSSSSSSVVYSASSSTRREYQGSFGGGGGGAPFDLRASLPAGMTKTTTTTSSRRQQPRASFPVGMTKTTTTTASSRRQQPKTQQRRQWRQQHR